MLNTHDFIRQVPAQCHKAFVAACNNRTARVVSRVVAGIALVPVIFVLFTVFYVNFDPTSLPDLDGFIRFEPPAMGHVYDANGYVLIELGRERREIVRYGEIPDVMREAILSAEDKNFFSHSGADYSAFLRLMVKTNVQALAAHFTTFAAEGDSNRPRVFPQGGSTITQQLVRGYFLQKLSSTIDSNVLQHGGILPHAYPAQAALRLPAAIFRTMISRTIFAISQEESRYMLNGALLILQPTSITMVATDGNRLAHIQAPASIGGVTSEVRVLIPQKALSEINTLLNFRGIEVFEFAKDDSTLYFRIGSRLLSCRQLVGTFPNYEPVLSRDYTRSLVLPCGEFSQAVQRVSQFSDERASAVQLNMQKKQFCLSSSSPETGESEEILDTVYAGEPMAARFNSRFLIEFLRAAGSDMVQFYFKEPTAAAEFRPNDGGGYEYRYVVMPIRT